MLIPSKEVVVLFVGTSAYPKTPMKVFFATMELSFEENFL